MNKLIKILFTAIIATAVSGIFFGESTFASNVREDGLYIHVGSNNTTLAIDSTMSSSHTQLVMGGKINDFWYKSKDVLVQIDRNNGKQEDYCYRITTGTNEITLKNVSIKDCKAKNPSKSPNEYHYTAAERGEICKNTGVPEAVRLAAGCSVNNTTATRVEDSIGNIIKVIVGLLGVISVIMIIFGGAKYMMAGGQQENIKKAKSIILYAVIGLIICAFAFAITNFVIDAVNGNISTSEENAEEKKEDDTKKNISASTKKNSTKSENSKEDNSEKKKDESAEETDKKSEDDNSDSKLEKFPEVIPSDGELEKFPEVIPSDGELEKFPEVIPSDGESEKPQGDSNSKKEDDSTKEQKAKSSTKTSSTKTTTTKTKSTTNISSSDEKTTATESVAKITIPKSVDKKDEESVNEEADPTDTKSEDVGEVVEEVVDKVMEAIESVLPGGKSSSEKTSETKSKKSKADEKTSETKDGVDKTDEVAKSDKTDEVGGVDKADKVDKAGPTTKDILVNTINTLAWSYDGTADERNARATAGATSEYTAAAAAVNITASVPTEPYYIKKDGSWKIFDDTTGKTQHECRLEAMSCSMFLGTVYRYSGIDSEMGNHPIPIYERVTTRTDLYEKIDKSEDTQGGDIVVFIKKSTMTARHVELVTEVADKKGKSVKYTAKGSVCKYWPYIYKKGVPTTSSDDIVEYYRHK